MDFNANQFYYNEFNDERTFNTHINYENNNIDYNISKLLKNILVVILSSIY